jgi:AcrR family transcriptional regulator
MAALWAARSAAVNRGVDYGGLVAQTTTPTTSRRRREKALVEALPTYQARRVEIIAAAGAAFLAKGFGATSFKDIAEAVGMDRASLYYYFESKQELFHAATSAAVARNVADAERVARGDAPPEDKIVEIVSMLLESYTDTDYPYMFMFLQEDVNQITTTSDDPWAREVKALTRRYEAAVGAILDDGIAAGAFRADAPTHVLTKAIIGMANWTHRWYRAEGPLSATQIADVFAQTFLHGICRPARDEG